MEMIFLCNVIYLPGINVRRFKNVIMEHLFVDSNSTSEAYYAKFELRIQEV